MGRHKQKTIIHSSPDVNDNIIDGAKPADGGPTKEEALNTLAGERAADALEEAEAKPRKKYKKKKAPAEEIDVKPTVDFTTEVSPGVKFLADMMLDLSLKVVPNPIPFKDLERETWSVVSNMMIQKHGEKISQWIPEIAFGLVAVSIFLPRLKRSSNADVESA